MAWLASLFLRILHSFYSLVVLISFYWKRYNRRSPQPLRAVRKQIPTHLAILFVLDLDLDPQTTDYILLESVDRAIGWCRDVGVEQLTMYDSQGLLLNSSQQIRDRVTSFHDSTNLESSDSEELEYPLTPPLSDDPESRPISPEDGADNELNVVTIRIAERSRRRKRTKRNNGVKRRIPDRNNSSVHLKPLTLHLVSQESSKQAIASTARLLARIQSRKSRKRIHSPNEREGFNISVDRLNSLLEGDHGLSSPDLIMLHSITPKHHQTPLELHGFPPWQIRLTEIHHDNYSGQHGTWRNWLHPTQQYSKLSVPLDEVRFREALDEFARAEMRLGK